MNKKPTERIYITQIFKGYRLQQSNYIETYTYLTKLLWALYLYFGYFCKHRITIKNRFSVTGFVRTLVICMTNTYDPEGSGQSIFFQNSRIYLDKNKTRCKFSYRSGTISSQSFTTCAVHRLVNHPLRPSPCPSIHQLLTWWKQPTASMADVEWLTLASIFKIYNSKKANFRILFYVEAPLVMSYQVSQRT